MSNPLMGAISSPKNTGNANLQMIQLIKQTMTALKSVANPQLALEQVAQKNPQLAEVMQMCQGRNPQEVFAERCKRYGVNPDEAIKQIQQMLS